MIRVMLVDDEAIVRRGIKESINWEKYGVVIAGEAQNGVAALEKIPEIKPDIVITDIRMPLMDGLKFAEKLKEINKNIKTVIISGYEDFIYAKKAMETGVKNYILKPVSDEEIIATVIKLKAEIESEQKDQENITDSKELLKKNYFHIKSKFVNNLIRNPGSLSDAKIEAEKMHICLEGPNYLVFVISIEDSGNHFDRLLIEDEELLKYAITNIAEETLFKNNKGVIVSDDITNKLIGIINTRGTQAGFMDVICEKIQENVNQFLGISISIGIGQCCNQLTDLGNAYEQAGVALKYKFYSKTKSTHVYNPKKKFKDSGEYVFPVAIENALLAHIKESDQEGLKITIKKLFDEFENELVDQWVVKEICSRLLNTIMKELSSMEIHLTSYIGKNLNPYNEIRELDTLAKIREHFSNLILEMYQSSEDYKNRKYKNIVLNAIKYMEAHYQRDITLAEISNVTHVSPNYFSKLFKNETGVNFIDWLNNLRIEKSYQLLQQNDLKIYEVANQVGYTDYKYYSALFKKKTGITPKQFRDGKRGVPGK